MSKPQQQRHHQGRPRPQPRPPKRPEHLMADHSAEGSAASTPIHRSPPPKTHHTAMIEPQSVTQTRFRDVPGVSKEMLNAIPFEFCTEVQAATLPTILDGKDLLAQAKTGTGKTLAFLVPSMQRLFATRPPSSQTSILVLSPTRELALQIGEAAMSLLRGMEGRYGVRCVVGGTKIEKDIRDLKSLRADVLVATPGRLLDLLDNGNLKPRLSNLRTLILDEADRLLDAGFRRELVKILDALPDKRAQPRQTLLFSATVPNEVHTIASLALNKDHAFITTLTEDDVNAHTHVIQESHVAPSEDILPALVEVIERERSLRVERGGFKVMVFLPTARAAALAHDLFTAMSLDYPVWEIHSRMSQSARTKTTEAFREAAQGVLFSSDVTARGIDVKGVTAVVQVGLPSSAEQYIHRLGRTARAGTEGHGILLLAEFERFFLSDKTIQTFNLQPYSAPTAEAMAHWRKITDSALNVVTDESKAQAYQAWLGYYNSNLRSLRWSQTDLVRHANEYARHLRYGIGQSPWTPPGLLAKTVGKMGLKSVPGLNIVREAQNGHVRPGAPRGGGKFGDGAAVRGGGPPPKRRQLESEGHVNRPVNGSGSGRGRGGQGRGRGRGGGHGSRPAAGLA